MAGREDGGEELRLARGVGYLLGREDDVDVLLAKGLEPRLEPAREDGVAEKEPGLVEDEQRRLASELLLDPMEEVLERRDDDLLAHGHQVAHLDQGPEGGLHVVVRGVEDGAEVAVERVRAEGLAQQPPVGADLRGEDCERALFALLDGRQAHERVVDRGSRFVIDVYGLGAQEGLDERGGPDALVGAVDVGEGLKGDGCPGAARLVAGAADGERRRAGRAILVEEDHLSAGVLEP